MMSLERQQLGRYHFERLLGSGGMGEVYLATDTRINRQVAIKVIRADASLYRDSTAAKEATRLFEREARGIATLDHPYILPLYDYGEEKINGAGGSYVYMVTPFRPEGSFAAWLREHNGSEPLSPSDVAHFVRQAAAALQYAHDRQIIHQDVKPSNFLIRFDNENPNRPDLLLADFGVAKFGTGTANSSQDIRGTPTFMAPEQWDGQPVPASDQYALAVMAYELLTGHPLFHGTLMQIIYQHTHTQPQPPSTLNPHIPVEIDRVLLRALAKNPAERFPSITAFAQAFQAALSSAHVPIAVYTQDALHDVDSGNRLASLSDHAENNLPTVANHIRLPIADDPMPPAQRARRSGRPQPKATYGRPHNFRISADQGRKSDSDYMGRTILLFALVLVLIGIGLGVFYYTNPKLVSNGKGNANATVITEQNPYTHGGALVLNDPLHDNSQSHQWEEGQRDFGFCQFTAGAYHVSEPQQGFFHSCIALNTDFTDFVYEVQMTMITGDYGGIVFRADRATTHFYYFRITEGGAYSLSAYIDKYPSHARLLGRGQTSSITVGLERSNLITVVARGNKLDLYVNHQLVVSVSDSLYSHGQIGVFVGNAGHSAQAVFSDAKVWML
jgi:eukaryotic-like serine/threonine-protein kinase